MTDIKTGLWQNTLDGSFIKVMLSKDPEEWNSASNSNRIAVINPINIRWWDKNNGRIKDFDSAEWQDKVKLVDYIGRLFLL